MKYLIIIPFTFLVSRSISQPFTIDSTIHHSGGEYQIYRSAVDSLVQLTDIRTPIIFVEGFDPLPPDNDESYQ